MARIKQPEVIPEKPTGPCRHCGGTEYWWDPANAFGPGDWNCKKCIPEPVDKTSTIIDGILNGRPVCNIPKPTGVCPTCRAANNYWAEYWWQPLDMLFEQKLRDGQWHCSRCRPKPANYVEPIMMVNGNIQEEKAIVSQTTGNVSQKAVVVSPEAEALAYLDKLRQRVAKGNLTLINYYKQVYKETEGYNQDIDKTLTEGIETLHDLVIELHEKGFHDCPFIVNGVKPRLCWSDKEGVGCFVCPSDKEYWKEENANEEFEKLGYNHVRRSHRIEVQGEEVMTFLKTLGGTI